MAKRYLSDKQKQQIQTLQTAHLETALTGLVVARYSDSLAVKAQDGKIFQCYPRQNLNSVVVGDQVAWQIEDAEKQTGTVLAVQPRHSEMWRKNQRGEKKIIAANVDQIIIVVAPEPKRSEQILDRYLTVAELQTIPAVIVFNKIDLLNATEYTAKQIDYSIYEKIGYPVLFVSPLKNIGVNEFTQQLTDKVSVIVGLSGVGKSSLVKSLLPEANIRIGELSDNRLQLGQHTTSTSRLYHLNNGGSIIDSPGVREFAMQGLSQRDIEQGFREFSPYLGRCKFRDCKHINDPGCVIKQAVLDEKIVAQRWEAYQKIINNASSF